MLGRSYFITTKTKLKWYKSQTPYICTNVCIPLSAWDKHRQRVKSSYKQANTINMLLERKVSEIREQLMIKALNSGYITTAQAKKLAITRGDLSFFTLADLYVEHLVKSDKVGSADKVRSIFSKFQSFLGNRNATFYDIDESALLEYQSHLKGKLGNSINTVHTNFKSIKRVFSMAVESNIISQDSDPFKRFKLKTEKAIRPFLTGKEIRLLVELELEPNSEIEKTRDVFIWTIISGGLRISDVLLLRKSNIEGDYLVSRIKKTGVPHRIKMPTQACLILNKYSSQIQEADGYIFQMIPENISQNNALKLDRAVGLATAVYNRNLKKLSSLAGIKKNLSSHIARISFITMAVSSGVDMTTVQGIAGHSALEMTAHYSKYVDNQGSNALSMLEKNIFSKV